MTVAARFKSLEQQMAFINSYGYEALAKLTPEQMQLAITHWLQFH